MTSHTNFLLNEWVQPQLITRILICLGHSASNVMYMCVTVHVCLVLHCWARGFQCQPYSFRATLCE